VNNAVYGVNDRRCKVRSLPFAGKQEPGCQKVPTANRVRTGKGDAMTTESLEYLVWWRGYVRPFDRPWRSNSRALSLDIAVH